MAPLFWFTAGSSSRRLQREEQSSRGRWCQLGFVCVGREERTGRISEKWCGSHLCTRVTAQVARELGVSTGRALEAAVVWCEGLAVLGRALGTPSVCWVWTQV